MWMSHVTEMMKTCQTCQIDEYIKSVWSALLFANTCKRAMSLANDKRHCSMSDDTHLQMTLLLASNVVLVANLSAHTCKRVICYLLIWVAKSLSFSRLVHCYFLIWVHIHVNESYHTRIWAMPHTWMIDLKTWIHDFAHTNESRYKKESKKKNERVMWWIWYHSLISLYDSFFLCDKKKVLYHENESYYKNGS